MDWENVQKDVRATFPDVRRLDAATLIQWCEDDGGRAVRLLQDMGYSDVYRLDGDLFGWVNAGRAVVKNGEPVNKAHPFNRRWGKLLRPENRAGS